MLYLMVLILVPFLLASKLVLGWISVRLLLVCEFSPLLIHYLQLLCMGNVHVRIYKLRIIVSVHLMQSLSFLVYHLELSK